MFALWLVQPFAFFYQHWEGVRNTSGQHLALDEVAQPTPARATSAPEVERPRPERDVVRKCFANLPNVDKRMRTVEQATMLINKLSMSVTQRFQNA